MQSHDEVIVSILKAIRELTTPTVPTGRPIGYLLTSTSDPGGFRYERAAPIPMR
jgi:hypothetical protein